MRPQSAAPSDAPVLGALLARASARTGSRPLGRVVRYRFSETVIAELLASKWWEKTIEELRPELDSFLRPLEDEEIR